jgi:2-polyprenyl-3-methyl-5-hydroxy-6-metoxy-1,4-benzoquinol methylase
LKNSTVRKKQALVGPFLTFDAEQINAARLEHLATLGLSISGKNVLELGAGIGKLTGFFLRRDNKVLVTEGRSELVQIIKEKGFQQWNANIVDVIQLDVEEIDETTIEKLNKYTVNPQEGFEVIFCYGLLYHLSNPDSTLKVLGELAHKSTGLLLLETVVESSTETFNQVDETKHSNQALKLGSRPNPRYILQLIKENFKHGYVSVTQPNHSDFQKDSNSTDSVTGRSRMIFVGSNKKLDNRYLQSSIPEKFSESS